MAHALGMRATSLGASALLLGAAVIAALTVTYSVDFRLPRETSPPTVVIIPQPEPPPPPALPQAPETPLSPSTELTYETPISPDRPFVETSLPFAAGPAGPVEITQPVWRQRPRDLARFYPAAALRREMEGAVVLDCRVSTEGALACSAISETPPGWGFTEAALRISRTYAMVPATRDGQAVEGRYRMRVPFALE